MKIFQSRSFERKVKKISKQEKSALDKQVSKIAENRSIGTEKKRDLRGVFIHKFKTKIIQGGRKGNNFSFPITKVDQRQANPEIGRIVPEINEGQPEQSGSEYFISVAALGKYALSPFCNPG